MKERQSNVELLRIISILGVIILHFNNKSIGGALTVVELNSLKFYILYTLESVFAIAVDIFMIISGFFLINSNKRNLWKVIELLFQVILFRVGKYLILGIFKNDITINGILMSLVPANYFVILYITVFILSPFINVLIHNLNEKNRKDFLMIMILVLSIYPTLVDVLAEIVGHQLIGLSSIGMYGSQWGYSLVNFILCYIIGANISINKEKLFKINTYKLILGFIINIIIILIWSIINDYTGYYTEKSALEYCNPIIILNSIIIFILFNKLHISSKIINELSKATFTVFLGHSVLLRKKIVEIIMSFNSMTMLLLIIIYAIFIYIIFYIINKIYLMLKKIMFSKLEEKYNLLIDV